MTGVYQYDLNGVIDYMRLNNVKEFQALLGNNGVKVIRDDGDISCKIRLRLKENEEKVNDRPRPDSNY